MTELQQLIDHLSDTNAFRCLCLHCNWKWQKRKAAADRPARCPNCKRSNWDQPNKEKADAD